MQSVMTAAFKFFYYIWPRKRLIEITTLLERKNFDIMESCFEKISVEV